MQFEDKYYVQAKDRAREWLFRIPGVIGVGLGPKMVSGKLTSEAAIQVFVQCKRNERQLSAAEIIPSEIDGIKTDVIDSPTTPQVVNGTQVKCRTGRITQAQVSGGDPSKTSPVEITSAAHGLTSGNHVRVFGVPLDESAAFAVQVTGPDAFLLPPEVNFVQQLALSGDAFWNQICSFEDDLCCSPSGPITEATSTNPVKIGSASHPLHQGDRIKVVSIAGMTQIKGQEFVIGKTTKDDFELAGVDGTLFTMATHEVGQWAKLCQDRTGPIQKVQMGAPIVFTSPGHPLKVHDRVHIITLATNIKEILSWDKAEPFTVDTVTSDTFTLEGVARQGDTSVITITGCWIRILPDTRRYSRIRGGIRIALERSDTVTPKADNASAGLVTTIKPTETVEVIEVLTYGTLGCVAVDNQTNAKVLLSNFHVLNSIPDETNVHHPDYSCCKSHKIGVRLRSADPGTTQAPSNADAAIAKLDDPGKADPAIIDIGPVNGTATIALQDILLDPSDPLSYRGYRVRKRGVTTLLTEGIVISLNADFHDTTRDTPIVLKNQIMIQAMAGGGCGAFALKGDSGSVVLNDQNMVVGLLCGGDGSGRGFASPIHEVETLLNITIWAATSTPDPSSSSGGSANGNDMVVTPSVPDLLAQVSEELVQTSSGAHFISLVQQHYGEVESLIHRNRRVTVAWHRNAGPALLQELYRFVQCRDSILPRVINGLFLRDCVENILTALRTFGSARLAADIQSHWQPILLLIAGSYTDMLQRLNASTAG